VNLVLQGSFRTTLLSICVTVEANEDELSAKGPEKVIVSNDFIIFVIINMRAFVCFDCQEGSVEGYTMVDTSAVVAATTRVERLVVNKTFEYSVNCLAHHCLAAL